MEAFYAASKACIHGHYINTAHSAPGIEQHNTKQVSLGNKYGLFTDIR